MVKWPKLISVFGKAEVIRESAGEKGVKPVKELQSKRWDNLFQSWAEETGNISKTHRAEGGDFKHKFRNSWLSTMSVTWSLIQLTNR